jgi:replicative DNA helicase
VPTAYHVEYYAKPVRDAAKRRDRIEAGRKIAAMAFDEDLTLEQLDSASMELLIDKDDTAATHISTHADVVNEHYEHYQRRGEHGRFRMGISQIDARIRLLPGRVITIAAPTGQGKTSFAECVSERIAREGGNVLYWSGEVPAEQMMDRRLCRIYNLPMEQLEMATLSDHQLARYTHACGEIAGWPGGIHIYDRSTTVPNLRALAARQQATTGLDLLVVDHLQLLQKEGKQSTYEALTEACKQIKQMAVDLRIPVLQLSQLSREFYKTEAKRPQLWHLKESGEIENSSDAVMFFWFDEKVDAFLRPAPGATPESEMAVEINTAIEKNRQGPRASFKSIYVAGRYLFQG